MREGQNGCGCGDGESTTRMKEEMGEKTASGGKNKERKWKESREELME